MLRPTSFTSPLLALGILATSFGMSGCEGETPRTNIDIDAPEIIIPQARSLQKRGEAQPLLSSAQNADTEEPVGECLSWETIEESYDEVTGDFTYHYACAEGGDVASSLTQGNDDGMGNGQYMQRSSLRDGTSIVWNYSYVLLPDGATQETTGSSTEGETYHGVRTYLADGSVIVDEEYGYLEGTYEIDGTYDADGRFTGTSVFDDPNTEPSPDYSLFHDERVDGSFVQTVDSIWENWSQSYAYELLVDGSSTYDFVNDDLLTTASPDIEGGYAYNADGSGTGAYTQNFDGGSVLLVNDSFDVAGNLHQTWTFDDHNTALDLDQEGLLDYTVIVLEDGSTTYTAVGSVTYFLEEGVSQTCTLTLDGNGNSSMTDCG